MPTRPRNPWPRYGALAGVAGVAGLAFAQMSFSQAAAPSGYDPLKTFAPLTLPDPVNVYRSGDGTPGPGYWQNRADYVIHARLDPASHTLAGSEVITYTNNSPSALDCLWIQLDQNSYRRDARAHYASGRQATQFTDGFVLESVQIEQHGRTIRADTLVSDTRLQIRLAAPVPAHGGRIAIRIRYHYTLPAEFGGRTAYSATRNGDIYETAQWYPRMVVFDDLRGWDAQPYLGAEFYLEYGDFDYFVTVPWDMLVAASGELQNPQQVLTPRERTRLAEARLSDRTVMIRSASEISDPASRPVTHGPLTWHYKMHGSRDVAFAASKAFIWDAARMQLPDGRSSLAMSFYPVESAGDAAWGRATEYLKDAVQNLSRRWGVYPYPVASAVAGPVEAMEYPALIFNAVPVAGKALFAITVHEIGHTWFPMLVGTNERRDQWMDEGFNTFIDIYESDDFEHGIYGPKRDAEYTPGGGNPVDEVLPLLADRQAPVLLTRADQIREPYRHSLTYAKSALGLVLLREQILGPERFDRAFRKFIRDWSYRHPSPSDFFRAMDSAGGEDLSWFWRGWYFNTWTLDLAARDAQPVDGDWHKGAVITIANLEPLVMPATVQVDFQDGSSQRLQLPAESWIRETEVRVRLDSTQPVTAVTVDPEHVIPDEDRGNNVWRAPASP